MLAELIQAVGIPPDGATVETTGSFIIIGFFFFFFVFLIALNSIKDLILFYGKILGNILFSYSHID